MSEEIIFVVKDGVYIDTSKCFICKKVLIEGEMVIGISFRNKLFRHENCDENEELRKLVNKIE
ncbi:MAG: hypothetical protein Q7R95_00010 [bacterium]|nr:hypothetical protein [bacterium]